MGFRVRSRQRISRRFVNDIKPLFQRDLEIQYWTNAVPPRFVVRCGETILMRTYLRDKPHALVIAAKLQQLAKAAANKFKDRDIYVHKECRRIINLPEFLTLAFFEEAGC